MVSEAVALQPRACAGYLCGIPWHFVGIRLAFCPVPVPPAPLPQSTRTCQLLSCHCEALRDPLVAPGVTDALGMGEGHGVWGEPHRSGLAEDPSCLTKAGVVPQGSLCCIPGTGLRSGKGPPFPAPCSQVRTFSYSPFSSSAGWSWDTLILHGSGLSARLLALPFSQFMPFFSTYRRHLWLSSRWLGGVSPASPGSKERDIVPILHARIEQRTCVAPSNTPWAHGRAALPVVVLELLGALLAQLFVFRIVPSLGCVHMI